MAKIAIIGAGSIIFSKTLLADMFATPALEESEYSLMAPSHRRLDAMAAFAERMIRDNGIRATVSSTTDRRKALRGVDYVIIMIQVGGIKAYAKDYQIPLRYGVDQCVGDSLGPGGIFRALRTIPALLEIAQDMRELCSQAFLLNYTNPMAMCCWALGTLPGLKFVGLCHGVQTTLDLLARYAGVPKKEIDFLAAGINHMAWFLRLEKRGENLYPLLHRNMENPEYYVNEKVRGEVMRHFGYFMTESSGHLSEYLPYFRKNQKGIKLYCDRPDLGGESGTGYKYALALEEKFKNKDPLSRESTRIGPRSNEYCSFILEALETGRPFRFHGNIRNEGYISNLPRGCCVEVPVDADQEGLHPLTVGALPPQCAALNMTNVLVQGLAVEAVLQADPELVMQAVAMDPLTSAVLTLAEIREMVGEMLEAEKEFLPAFAGKALRPTPSIRIPPDVVPVEVPLDPALAIAHRFTALLNPEEKNKPES